MRTYPRNSAEAAARIVALVLIADGHVCRSEFEALNQLDTARELGLSSEGLPQAVQTLCEDLLMGAHSDRSLIAQVDGAALAAIMAEVQDPTLQAKVLALATAAARDDRHLAEGETLVLEAAQRHWHLSDAVIGLPAKQPVRLAA